MIPIRVLGGLALVVIVVVAVVRLVAGDDGGATVRVELENAAGLVARDEVRMAGVVVGEISALDVTADTHAAATVRLRDGLRLRDGVRAEVRASNLFGGKFLALLDGRGAPLADGATVPRSRTSAPVEIDDVLDTLDPDTRTALGTVLVEAGVGLGGRGRDLRRFLAVLPDALPAVTTVVEDLRADRRTLGPLIEESDRVIAAFAADRRRIGRFVATAGTAASGFAREERRLRATVARAPGLLRQLRTTLRGLDVTAARLGPAADALRSTAGPLDRTLAELGPVERDARATLDGARRAAGPLAALGRTTRRTLDRGRPSFAALERFARDLAPVSRIAAEEIRPLVGVLQGWARATQEFDPLGHFFRGEFVLNADDIVRTVTDLPTKTRPARRRPGAATPAPSGSSTPAPTSSAPAERPKLPTVTVPGLPPLDVQGLLDGLVDPGGTRSPLLDHLLRP